MSKAAVIRTPKPAQLWEGVKLPDGYTLRDDGLHHVSQSRKASQKIAGPVWVSAYTHDAVQGTHGVVVNWRDRKGHSREQAIPADQLHTDGRTLAQRLARFGLEIVPGKEQMLSRYLGSFDAKQTGYIRSAPRVGWLESLDEHLAYVLPTNGGEIIANDDGKRIIFQPEQHSPTADTIFPNGALDQWKKEIAAPCRGNPFLVFALCAAFAGPLLKPARVESGGIHYYGRSSRGKTTAAQVAASVWGCGADPSDTPSLAYIQKWNTTGNALEALLAAHNDGLLVLDEIHTCESKDFGAVVYNLAGGRGRARLDKNADLRQRRSWQALVFSTGEISVRQKIEEGIGTAHAGQLLRLLDIPTHEDIIQHPHGVDTARFVQDLKRACANNFGTAGPAYLHELVGRYKTHSALSAVVRRELDACTDRLTTARLEAEQGRVIRRFALFNTAGRLASELEILPFGRDEVDRAAHAIVRAWLAVGSNLSDAARGAQAVQSFIQRHASRFRAADKDDEAVRDLAGYRTKDFYLFTAEGFREACAGSDLEDAARELARAGLLFRNEGDRLLSKHQVRINGDVKRLRLYAVKVAILEHDFSSNSQIDISAGTSGTPGHTHENKAFARVPAMSR